MKLRDVVAGESERERRVRSRMIESPGKNGKDFYAKFTLNK